MKLMRLTFLTFVVLLTSTVATAQFSINNRVTPPNASTKRTADSLKRLASINNNYFNESQYLAERRRIRKERNTVELNTTLELSQTSFDNWAKGGDNSFSGRAAFFFRHQHQRDKFNITYSYDARYGISVIADDKFKNEDAFNFNLNTSWRLTDRWSYSAATTFRSQFSKGYKSRTDSTLVSDFMAPGTWDVSVGFRYKNKPGTLIVNISPIGGSMTFVLNEELSDLGKFGVEKGKNQVSTLGSSIQLDYNKKFSGDKFSYKTYFYTFSNFSSNTYITWNNKLELNAGKIFKISAFCSTVYDKYATTPRNNLIQLNYVLGLGIGYNFKNK